MPFKRVNLVEHFLNNIQPLENGCWEWLGSRNPATGYATFHWHRRAQNKTILLHRFSYEFFRGEIPSNLQIDHLCRNRWCVNPDHLEVVTCAINVLRGASPPAKRARQISCIHGHSFDLFNTYINKNGERFCRACNKERQRRYKAEGRYANIANPANA